jgi:hypothetical protein
MAGNLNIETYVGDDVAKTLKFRAADRTTAINLTGKTFEAKAFNTDGTVAATFTTTVATPASGDLVLSLSDTVTTSLGAGSWRWSLVETQSGVTTTLLVGTFTVTSEV